MKIIKIASNQFFVDLKCLRGSWDISFVYLINLL